MLETVPPEKWDGWELNGIRGRGQTPPRCAGNFSGLALVIATGRCAWEDIEAFDIPRRKPAIIAVNNMILDYHDRVHHACSLHAEEPPLWVRLRGQYGCDSNHVSTHAYRKSSDPQVMDCDYIWDIVGSALAGTSTLFAVAVALALGYSKVVVAGAPLDGTGHYYDPPKRETRQFMGNCRQEWVNAHEYFFNGRVRSMSGFTMDLLGYPSQDWIDGN